jgi:hypothetical protein
MFGFLGLGLFFLSFRLKSRTLSPSCSGPITLMYDAVSTAQDYTVSQDTKRNVPKDPEVGTGSTVCIMRTCTRNLNCYNYVAGEHIIKFTRGS